jgi:hypothetical protein
LSRPDRAFLLFLVTQAEGMIVDRAEEMRLQVDMGVRLELLEVSEKVEDQLPHLWETSVVTTVFQILLEAIEASVTLEAGRSVEG